MRAFNSEEPAAPLFPGHVWDVATGDLVRLLHFPAVCEDWPHDLRVAAVICHIHSQGRRKSAKNKAQESTAREPRVR